MHKLITKLDKSEKTALKKISNDCGKTMSELIRQEIRKLLIENNIRTF